ncbi:SgcJ/EcaC family oxidoreductase [Ruania zhangjianzhongii]|uniref:SgcJ/EcaC family oxidoreductase n=1 Tax=Ruania zhangjianzhongii TaxID=2603206 RepID=UPI0011C7481C|nr:SgcJ/EcaC family oxidoreductase [Ruania zhangjianzhongii]
MNSTATTSPPEGSTSELDAIRDVVATVEHAQNNEQPEEFLELFRPDAIWTTGGGKRLYGLEAIASFTRRTLPGGMTGLSVTFTLEHVMFIRPDVAAVKLRQVYRAPDGTDVGSPLWILAKEQGRWLLSACQNMGVPDDEEVSPDRPVFSAA